MHFSSDINRPPYEAQDAYLEVTSGSSHDTCDFSSFYKDARLKPEHVTMPAPIRGYLSKGLSLKIGEL